MAGYYFEVLETVEEPEAIFEGKEGEYIAVREVEKGKYVVVSRHTCNVALIGIY